MTADLLVSRVRHLGLKGITAGEVRFVHDTLAAYRPDLIVEWGTNVGHTARMFYEATVALDLDCDVHTADVHEPVPVLRPEEKGLGMGFFVRGCPVCLHLGDGPSVALSLCHALQPLRPLFFVDDNHQVEHVFAELVLLSEGRPDAVILMHDTIVNRSQEPDQALRRFLKQNDGYEVASVVSGQSMVRLWPK